jgi:hypothetical protein
MALAEKARTAMTVLVTFMLTVWCGVWVCVLGWFGSELEEV